MSKWKTVDGFSEVKYGRYIVPNFAANSISVDADDGRICVISPGAALLDSFAEEHPELEANGGALLDLVMPNSYHYLGVEKWKERFPNASLWSSKKAIKRLAKQGVRNISVLEDRSPGPLAGSFWVTPPGHRGGDIWLVLERNGEFVWITCDSFLHYPKMSNQPMARMTQRLMGAAPGLKLSKVIKYFLLTDRSSFKRWGLYFLSECPPGLLLPSHGELLVDPNLPQLLKDLLQTRL